ncbi:flagellar biosynthesis, cell-distal portion of basal-body rod [Klebsiella quasipneumoniae]|uniref:hypothetical protein n=1 Tax=Klebsiella quasipneumoniae TaxID=1463165 RepID=UPI0010D520B6|nr:hypothetical protein [Klebsiella quasipneumoniae]VGF49723.1 flagellar biosynthesis, cell-distal portion of basal-body rod [Klebsiella quasipneumoniae]
MAADLNPPLGTTTPEIFLDNVKRADRLVNGPAGTVDDRGGEPLDTWRQMMAKNDEVRQNLIPLSRQYMTLEAAQADIVNIPDGSTTYYRSPDDSALAIEVINNGGTLEATGRKMPSAYALDRYFQVLPDGSLVISGENGAVLVIDKTAATHLVELIIQNQIRIGGLRLAQGENDVPLMMTGDNGVPFALDKNGTLRTVGINIFGSGLSGESFGAPLLIGGRNGIAGAVDNSATLHIPAVITDELTVAGKKITGDGGSSGPSFSSGDRYIDADGNVMPLVPDSGKMSAWGSSSFVVAGASANFAALAQELGVADWNNQGQGGESSFQVAARWGAIPFTLVFPGNVIPASGTVAVTCTQLPSNFCNNFLKTYSGVVGGVAGTLSWSSASLQFTRATDGAAVSLSGGTDFIPTIPASYRDGVVLIWSYKNDMKYSTQTEINMDVIFNNVVKSFAHASTLAKRVLVIGIFNDSSYTNELYKTRLAEMNSRIKAHFGDLYCDTQDYICSSQIWTDTGITPTADDLAMQASGYKATSLSADSAHLNTTAHKAVVEHVIKPKLISLGWYTEGE